jgi:hypothetical protein
MLPGAAQILNAYADERAGESLVEQKASAFSSDIRPASSAGPISLLFK